MDQWIVRGRSIIREFRTPRQMTFTPRGSGCPVDASRLKAKRVTHSIRIDDAEGAIQVTEDDWRTATMPYFNPFELGV